MKAKNKYKDIIDNLEIYKELDATDTERYLLAELDDLLKLDRFNKLVTDKFKNNATIKKILREINIKIVNYSKQILDIQAGVCNIESIEILDKKIADLKGLKSKIENFLLPTSDFNKYDIQRLVNICAESLDGGEYSTTSYFGRSLVDSNIGEVSSANEEVVEAVYAILSDESLMNELNDGVEIEEKKRKVLSTLGVYDEALLFKGLVYANKEDIFLYSDIRSKIAELNEEISKHGDSQYDIMMKKNDLRIKELNGNFIKSFVNKQKISKLQLKNIINSYNQTIKNTSLARRRELIEKLDEVKKRLVENGLGSIILKIDANASDFSKEENIPLSLDSQLPTFDFTEDIDFYYKKLNDEIEANLEKLHSIELMEEEFKENATDEAYEMISDFYDTSKNIVNLGRAPKKADVSPALALFVIEAIVIMKKSRIGQMGITEEDSMRVNEFFEDNFDREFENFESEYIDIIYSRYSHAK